MKKELFDEVRVRVEDEVPYDMKLTYYLLTGNVDGDLNGIDVYGVEIDKEVVSGKLSEGIERKIITELFFKKSDAVEFLKTISCNKVTPMELKYILKDHIYQKIEMLSVDK